MVDFASLFGQEYIERSLAWYKQIGVSLPTISYVKDHQGQFVNQDGSVIRRDSTRERDVIKQYLLSQIAGYQEELRSYAASLPAMTPQCRLSIQIPAYNEQPHIYDTLREWATQLSQEGRVVDPSIYEINILNNGPRAYRRDNTLGEIKRFKRDFPKIYVNVVDIEFNLETGNVGLARKLITDITLQRSWNRLQQQGPLYIESGDADVVEIEKQLLLDRIQRLDRKPYLDALSGQHDFSPHILVQNEYLLFSLRAHAIAIELLRSAELRPERNKDFSMYNQLLTIGWNTAFTAEAYALIGGYLPVQLGEDFDLGRRISILRGMAGDQGRFIPNTYTVEKCPTRMQSSPRRFMHAMKNDARAYIYFGDIKNMNEVRAFNLSEMLALLPHEKLSPDNLAVFEKNLTKQWQFFTRLIKDTDKRLRIFHRFMLCLGFGRYRIKKSANRQSTLHHSGLPHDASTHWKLDYHIDSDGRVVIDDIGNITHALGRYRERHAASTLRR